MKENLHISLNDADVTQFHEHPMYPVFVELKAASDAVEDMGKIGVGNFHSYEISWQRFLQAIDRCWNKLQVVCYGRKGWQTLESKIANKRKKDQLLNYLTQARNVSEHSISPTIKEWDANLKAKSIKGGIQLNWSPYDRPLLDVTNRGRLYLTPKEHLGKSMREYRSQYPNEPEPIVAAILAMNFYVYWVNETLEKIFPFEMVKK